MFADPKQTVTRRLRRQIKAGVSIVVALAAGAWLSTRAEATNPGRAAGGPDARVGPQRHGSAPPPPRPPPPNPRATGLADAATGLADGSADARDTGIVRAADANAPRVDRHEHRNGMPVRDNLLE